MLFIVISRLIVGLIVGLLIGLTGLGGGVLLLPILIFGMRVPPLIAVGTDAVFNFFTKVGAGLLHWRQRTVNWRLVGALAFGSLPGSVVGVEVLSYLRSTYGTAVVNDFLRLFLGIVLVLVTVLIGLQKKLENFVVFRRGLDNGTVLYLRVAAIGVAAGCLVGMSSIGSGTIIMMLLLLFISASPAMLVGTDIVHAAILTGCTSLLHFHLGSVDRSLAFGLLVGSMPGALLGVRFSSVLPSLWLRRVLCVILFATGARMLWI